MNHETGSIPPPPQEPDVLRLPVDAYIMVSRVLRTGLAAGVALFLLGLATYLVRHPATSVSQADRTNPLLPFLNFSDLLHGLAQGQGLAILTLGVFVLLATPVARVLTGWYYFHREGEVAMGVVTLAVFLLLLLGLFVVGPLVTHLG